MGDLRIGTSGWNYPSGQGTWNGIFYPPGRGRPKGFDELEYYAAHFDTVEVNSTFYGQPRPDVTRAWVERTPPGFEFSVKLYQKFTHPRMFADRVGRTLAGADPSPAVVQALAQPLAADLDEFKRGIEPLAEAGRLGALLAQFPASFKNGDAERQYLTDLLRSLAGLAVAVELRHKTWSDRQEETLALLKPFGAALVQIDEPKFRLSIQQNLLPNTAGLYYLRLHGRNAKAWWAHKAAEDRYNYLYAVSELQEFSTAIEASKDLVKKAYLYANNHYSAQSVANAAMIKHQVGQPNRGGYSDEFLRRFPELAGIVERKTDADERPTEPTVATTRLFDP